MISHGIDGNSDHQIELKSSEVLGWCFNDSIPLNQATIPITRHAKIYGIHTIVMTTYKKARRLWVIRGENSLDPQQLTAEMIDRLGGSI